MNHQHKLSLRLSTLIIALAGLALSIMILQYAIATSETEVAIWTGWASCESGAEGGRSAGSDHGHAYGLFQFDDRYDSLYNFLAYCISTDAEAYEPFVYYYETYRNNRNIVAQSETDMNGLISAWHNAYDADPDGFTSLQLDVFQNDYYVPVISMCNARGIDIQDDKYSPVIRGTLWSISIWAGATNNGVGRVINHLAADMDEAEMLDICYSEITASLKDATASQSYKSAFRTRWKNTQRNMALQAYTKWLSGVEIATTESEDIAMMFASSGRSYGIDGGSYVDYIKQWIDAHQDLSQEFKDSGGWNTDNKEWCITLRNAGDFYELYGILGGGLPLDLTAGTSGGYYIGGSLDVNAELFEIPDNGGSMPIPFYSQGHGAPWAGLPFGGGTIASSGCSITSLSMVISYLNGGTDNERWVFPSNVRDMIQAKTGNYNTFYVGVGQSWDIMGAVAGYYELHCSEIGSGSIVSALASGRPVIMSCKPGEFTSGGHFIVLTGLTEDGYIVVNDPAHPDKSYRKYTASYLASQGKGWWCFWK